MSKEFGIILSLDSNENMIDGRIQKLLSKLGLKESMSNFANATPPPTFYEGLRQINIV